MTGPLKDTMLKLRFKYEKFQKNVKKNKKKIIITFIELFRPTLNQKRGRKNFSKERFITKLYYFVQITQKWRLKRHLFTGS